MKVSGFTIIKNAIIHDYPVLEAIQSVLPLCDEFIVNVGQSDDKTLELIQSIDSTKIKIYETIWDQNLRKGGSVLAVETDKALANVSNDTDWCFYIQSDEVLPEKYHDAVVIAMKKHLTNENVDGLLFKYLHFYGSYEYIASSSSWYKNEIRVIRKNNSIFSYKDAQGFRKKPNEKLSVKEIDAFIYHYGWVKDPRLMQNKQKYFQKLWHDDDWIEKHVQKGEYFDYSGIDSLNKFNDVHPSVMQKRIKEKNWEFDFDLTMNKISLKDNLKDFMKKHFGLDFNYKNYKII
ncbi:MAG: glycosyltransferase family 2 protein [Lewinellaceae bacterium]|nr:glycosyltransferase family 2 protein [Lewinellaceae bacterium]